MIFSKVKNLPTKNNYNNNNNNNNNNSSNTSTVNFFFLAQLAPHLQSFSVNTIHHWALNLMPLITKCSDLEEICIEVIHGCFSSVTTCSARVIILSER